MTDLSTELPTIPEPSDNNPTIKPDTPATTFKGGGEGVDSSTIETATMSALKEQAPSKPAVLVSPSSPEHGKAKRDAIRQRLREKERKLNQMMATPRTSRAQAGDKGMTSDGNSTISEDVLSPLQSPTVIIRTEGKDEADRREAVRVLSQAALQMKEKLGKQRQEAARLQQNVNSLNSTLSVKEDQKSLLKDELEKIRQENRDKEEELLKMQRALDDKTSSLRKYETVNVAAKEMDLQNQLTAAYEEVVWTQKDSMSKAEQLEYFEYQLLAKNQEIDDMKQDLNAKLRQIVALEVDLEIHDDRFSTAMDLYSRTESGGGSMTITTGDNMSCRKEMIIDNPPPVEDKHNKGSLGGIRKMLSFRRKSSRSLAASRLGFDDGSSYSHVDRIQSELNNLEARYKRDKYNSRMQIEQLKQENNEYLIKVLSLEKSLQNAKSPEESVGSFGLTNQNFTKESLRSVASQNTRSTEDGDILLPPSADMDDVDQGEELPNKSHFLEEKVTSLENKNGLHNRTIRHLRDEIEKLEDESNANLAQHEQAVQVLLLESQTKDLKVAALERELHDIAQTTNRSIKGLHVNAAVGLEARLQENLTEVVRLRKEQEIKDKKIEALRAEIIELRLVRMQYEKATQGGGGEAGANARLEPITEDGGAFVDERSMGAISC